MVEQAFATFKHRKCTVSINLSIDDIIDSSTRDFIIQSIQKTGIGSHLVLEIVESEGIESFQEAKTFIEEVKALGCQIAIDDFGTGYSNFSYLLQLNPDFIKIDGSMIRNITIDKNSWLIVQTIVHFAKSIGMKTVAEFVKDEATFKAVKELGIDYSQGYYFSPPLPTVP
jgi:EAL domain-containing protein (putative c-di-GMP-specific phosphodiesterase class I)